MTVNWVRHAPNTIRYRLSRWVIAEKLRTELISSVGEGRGKGEDGEAISHPPMRQSLAFWVKALREMEASGMVLSFGGWQLRVNFPRTQG